MKPPIVDEEWDFYKIPNERLREAVVYEYGRSEPWGKATQCLITFTSSRLLFSSLPIELSSTVKALFFPLQ